jgi:pyruvate dehydrogenase E2 component (dihydrolipoamide acetyltransferase)
LIIEVVMPNLGATGGDVILEEWLAGPGDWVKAGAPLFVVTTDKATVEVEAFQAGFLRQVLAEPGTSVAPGSRVALLSSSADEPVKILKDPETTGRASAHRQEQELPSRVLPDDPRAGRILASPLARRMARERGLDLQGLDGSGRHGEILKRDILHALERQPAKAQGTAGPAPGVRFRRVPVTAMRRSIANRTRNSKAEIPHFYATATMDMEAAQAFLAQARRYAEKRSWPVPTLTDLILRATALALRQVPQLNASFHGEEIYLYEEINIGLAVALPEGMVIPVVRNADHKNLYTIAATTQRLKDQALHGGLASADLTGATFTISNLGMYGLDSFTAVHNPPEAGILAVGSVRKAPAVWEDQVLPRWSLTATLSVDHRAIDGVDAARFMEELKMVLENPVGLALDAPQEPGA